MQTVQTKSLVSAHVGHGLLDSDVRKHSDKHLGKVQVLTDEFVVPNALRPGERGILVEEAPMSGAECGRLRQQANALFVRDLSKNWFKKKGSVNKKLLALAKINADPELHTTVYVDSFRTLVQFAVKHSRDDVLQVCRKALEQHKDIPVDAVFAVERAALLANSHTHDTDRLDNERLRQLAGEQGGADDLAQSVGYPEAAPMIKMMAKDLL